MSKLVVTNIKIFDYAGERRELDRTIKFFSKHYPKAQPDWRQRPQSACACAFYVEITTDAATFGFEADTFEEIKRTVQQLPI